jgi:hypothetical protein
MSEVRHLKPKTPEQIKEIVYELVALAEADKLYELSVYAGLREGEFVLYTNTPDAVSLMGQLEFQKQYIYQKHTKE